MTPPLIVIGASAGGLAVVQKVLSELPLDLNAVICVVVHIPPWRKSYLSTVLTVPGRPAVEPMNHQPLTTGRVFVAPPDHHFILEDGQALLWHGPKENSQRPSVNALFRSAAVTYGPKVIGVVLSGALEDGATGLWWIHRHGGITVVQDPSDAAAPAMPQSALASVDVDYCVRAAELAPLLTDLVTNGISSREPRSLHA